MPETGCDNAQSKSANGKGGFVPVLRVCCSPACMHACSCAHWPDQVMLVVDHTSHIDASDTVCDTCTFHRLHLALHSRLYL